MAIDPNDFDAPVKDYAFDEVTTTASLLDQMAQAGGFTATKLATARDILVQMRDEIDAVKGDAGQVCNWLSFPACLCATGTRSFFIQAIKTKMLNYGEIIEAVVMPALEDIYNDRLKETGKTGADAWIGFGSIHLVWELGKRIGKPNSLIYWAWKNQVPVSIPGITDGSIAAQFV